MTPPIRFLGVGELRDQRNARTHFYGPRLNWSWRRGLGAKDGRLRHKWTNALRAFRERQYAQNFDSQGARDLIGFLPCLGGCLAQRRLLRGLFILKGKNQTLDLIGA